MKTKVCSKCEEEKDLSEFYKQKKKKDGLRSQCKTCMNDFNKEYGKLNKEKVNEIKYKYTVNNREKTNQSKKNWFLNNPEYREQYYIDNKDYILGKSKNFYKDNTEKVITRCNNYSKNNKEKINKYIKEKRKNDPLFRLKSSVRSRLNEFLKNHNILKTNKSFEIIGCSPQELKVHLEKQFTDGMNWNNYGFYGWHMDHKIPLYYGKTEEQIYKLCHFSNIQPLWWKENFSKGNKIL